MSWWMAAALAAEPVVHEGDPADAVARVAEAARIAPEDLVPTAVETLRAAPPALIGSGRVLVCEGAPVTREQLELALKGAEGALAYGETERVGTELARVADVERCPPASTELLVRYWVTRAQVDAEPGRAFSFARALAPDLSFGAEWRSDLQPAFDAAAPRPAVTVQVPQAGVAIDGVPVAGRVVLVPGWHALAAPGVAGAAEVDGDAVLVVPSATPVDLLGAVSSEDGRRVPTALLAQAFGEGRRVFVASDEEVWAATAGRTDWLSLQRRRTHPLVPVGLVTGAVGAGATVVASALALVAWGDLNAASVDVSGATTTGALLGAEDAFDAAEARYSARRWLPVPAGVVLATGIGLTSAGLAIGPVTVGGR